MQKLHPHSPTLLIPVAWFSHHTTRAPVPSCKGPYHLRQLLTSTGPHMETQLRSRAVHHYPQGCWYSHLAEEKAKHRALPRSMHQSGVGMEVNQDAWFLKFCFGMDWYHKHLLLPSCARPMPGKRVHLLSGSFPRATSPGSGHSVSTGSPPEPAEHIQVSWVTLWCETLVITSGTRYRATDPIPLLPPPHVCMCVKSASAWAKQNSYWLKTVLWFCALFPIISSPEDISGVNALQRLCSIPSYDTAPNSTEWRRVWKAIQVFPTNYRRQFPEWKTF